MLSFVVYWRVGLPAFRGVLHGVGSVVLAARRGLDVGWIIGGLLHTLDKTDSVLA